ncbi:MAG: GNAT family N-acetyltransferase [Candidatus Nanoarchaeia archaeon]|nr:GNAT family N-acetyltransferase [Candidatus Nanoarchaeia archaeon]
MEILKKNFFELTTKELYDILHLRSEIFVLEQNCLYQDLDEIDKISIHYFLIIDGEIVSYLRTYKDKDFTRITRVCTKKDYRKKGYSKTLINNAIKDLDKPILIHAQNYLKDFYESFGFKKTSEIFLEDGIEHIIMVLRD